jgi:hypothetical protein
MKQKLVKYYIIGWSFPMSVVDLDKDTSSKRTKALLLGRVTKIGLLKGVPVYLNPWAIDNTILMSYTYV